MKNKDIDLINAWLLETYGSDLLKRPMWRIVWSVGIMEKRVGEFHDYCGPIFIRAFHGVREMPKYQYHPTWRDRWILEKLMFDLPNPEILVDQAGTYEPIYVFYDRHGNYQKPTRKAVEYFMFMLLQPKAKVWDWEAAGKKEVDDEAEFFYGCMEDRFGGSLADALRNKEAVVNPGVLLLPDGKEHWFNRSENAGNSSQPSPVADSGSEAGLVPTGVQDSSGSAP